MTREMKGRARRFAAHLLLRALSLALALLLLLALMTWVDQQDPPGRRAPVAARGLGELAFDPQRPLPQLPPMVEVHAAPVQAAVSSGPVVETRRCYVIEQVALDGDRHVRAEGRLCVIER